MGEWLDLAAAAELLRAPEETVTRWVRQGLLPCRGNLPHVRFERDALLRWARTQGLARKSRPERDASYEPDLLVDALLRGSIQRGSATDAAGAIEEALAHVPGLPDEAREDLLAEVLGRERLASTGMGHGVALPHPRRPPGRWIEEPRVSLLLLDQPVDWASLDGEHVRVVFLLLSPSVPVHLELLARVSQALHDPKVRELLHGDVDGDVLIETLRDLRREG